MIQPDAARSLGRTLIAWYRRSRRDLPWRRSRDPYRVWISEVMLQQTTVRAVIPHYRRFLRLFPTIEKLAAARADGVLAAWSGLGYYRRARDLHQSARLVVQRHGGRFPRRLEEALALPGIGRYTAGAVLSIAYGEPLPVVDGNVARVLSRLWLLRGGPRPSARERRLWDGATLLARSTTAPGDFNQALMELGATICTPRDPACPVCPVASICLALAAGAQNRIPPPHRPVRAPLALRSDIAVVRRGERLLLRRRADPGLMRGLWEFPTLPAEAGTAALRLRLSAPIATLRHSITYRRLELRVRPARLLSEPPSGYRWLRPSDLSRLPTSSIVSKVLAILRDNGTGSVSGRERKRASASSTPGPRARQGRAGLLRPRPPRV